MSKQYLFMFFYRAIESKPVKIKTPQSNSKKKAAKIQAKKIEKTPEKVTSPKIETTESPENKPQNGQGAAVKHEEESPKKAESNVLKLQAAGAGGKGADYNPGKKRYHPIDDAFWKRGEK